MQLLPPSVLFPVFSSENIIYYALLFLKVGLWIIYVWISSHQPLTCLVVFRVDAERPELGYDASTGRSSYWV